MFYYGILAICANDICPINSTQTFYAAFMVISGNILTAFIFGNMTYLMQAMNAKDNIFADKFD
jgi:hypothetical protein